MKRSQVLGMFTVVLAGILSLPAGVFAAATATGTTNLKVTVANEAAITVNTANTTLTTSVTDFSTPYTGTTNFTFKVRTSQTTGAATITVEAGTDLSDGTDTIPAGSVTFTSTAAVGAAQSGTLSKTAAQNVTTFGADAHSATAGSAGTVTWSLPDDPAYKTGAYSSVVTFTISAT